MCKHVNTSEFIPALVSAIAEKRGSESFRIPESALWKIAKGIEGRCWSNVLLTRTSLDDLVEEMRKRYGNSFIEYELDAKDRSLVLQGVAQKYTTAMSNYYFDKMTKWYEKLSEIIERYVTIDPSTKEVFVDEIPLVTTNNSPVSEPIEAL